MNIAIYGTGHQANTLVEYLSDNHNEISISCFVESKKTKELFWGYPVIEPNDLKNYSFNYIVIAIEKYEEILQYLKNNYLDEYISLEHQVISVIRFYKLIGNKNWRMPYHSTILNNGLSYVYTSEDMYIGRQMLESGVNFAEWQILLFFELVDNFYGKKERNGYFFDIGANIGTTAIYAKKIKPLLKIYAIEAGQNNFDLLRVNCILNHMDDIKTVQIALGNTCGENSYYYCINNPGGSGFYDLEREEKSHITTLDKFILEGEEKVHITTLDKFIVDSNISPNEIDYIWMDVEGYEAKIIEASCIIQI